MKNFKYGIYLYLHSTSYLPKCIFLLNGFLNSTVKSDDQTFNISSTGDTEIDDAVLLRSARSFIWPDENQLVLEVNVAKAILESELLVQEDDEFLHNFVLNEETLAEYERLMTERPSRMSSLGMN